MNESIIVSENPHVKVTPYSLEFELGTTWEEARQIGIQLLRQHDKIQFYLGDWILYCTSISGWGKYYEEALAKTDYPYDALAHFVVVAGRFSPAQRQLWFQNHKCSFTRLRLVASLADEQIEYLFTRADTEGWSCDRLREEVQKLKSPATKIARWWANLTDPIRRMAVLSIPHEERIIPKNKKKVYVLTGVSELPELSEGQNETTG